VEEFERAVVARRDDRVAHRRVETPATPGTRFDRELDYLEQLGPDASLTRLVELLQLGVGAKARQDGLEPPELRLDLCEQREVLRLEQELDLGPHRGKGVACHEVRVVVRGGRVTTRTEGAALRRPVSAATRAASALSRRVYVSRAADRGVADDVVCHG
jgi:hypothetical protein